MRPQQRDASVDQELTTSYRAARIGRHEEDQLGNLRGRGGSTEERRERSGKRHVIPDSFDISTIGALVDVCRDPAGHDRVDPNLPAGRLDGRHLGEDHLPAFCRRASRVPLLRTRIGWASLPLVSSGRLYQDGRRAQARRIVVSALEIVGGYLMLQQRLTGWWILAFGIALNVLRSLLSFSILGLLFSLAVAYVHLHVKPRYIAS